jgi:hypothetical protein
MSLLKPDEFAAEKSCTHRLAAQAKNPENCQFDA